MPHLIELPDFSEFSDESLTRHYHELCLSKDKAVEDLKKLGDYAPAQDYRDGVNHWISICQSIELTNVELLRRGLYDKVVG